MQTRLQGRIGLVVLTLLLTACGASFTDRAQQTLSVALVATNAARDEFTAWDKARQQEIVDTATTREAAEAGLAAYRAKRVPVIRAFTIAYTTIAAAAATIPLVIKGVKSESDLLPLLGDAASAAGAVRDAYNAIKD